VAAAGLDPLAVRLALLEHRYREPVYLTWDALRAADRALRRRRARVAEWSESPSRPMPAEHVTRIEAAFDDDLDTPLALRLLDGMEADESLAPGSRFEAFLHLDQVLGLDLSLDIGRPRTLPPGAAELLERRRIARESGDQAACGLLTRELAALGVEIADTPQGQSWTVRDDPR
jgi:cysteinyl-tRNA synthetase